MTTSPREPSGPGSTTYKALTRPASMAVRRAEVSASWPFPCPTAKPTSRAPLTLGASVEGTMNFAPAGCGFGLIFHATVTAFTPSLPSSPVTTSLRTKSSSVAAWAETRKRTDAGSEEPAF